MLEFKAVKMKTISTFIAIIIAVSLTIVSAIIIYPMISKVVTQQTQSIQTAEQIECANARIRILKDTIQCKYENGKITYLNFSVENYGTIDLYNLKVVLKANDKYFTFDLLDSQTNKAFTKENPLRKGETRQVKADLNQDITSYNIDWINVITHCMNIDSGKVFGISCL